MPNKFDYGDGLTTAEQVEDQYLENCQEDVRKCLAEELSTFEEKSREPATVARMQASLSQALFSFYIGEEAQAAGYDDMARIRDRLKQLASAKERWALKRIMFQMFAVSRWDSRRTGAKAGISSISR